MEPNFRNDVKEWLEKTVDPWYNEGHQPGASRGPLHEMYPTEKEMLENSFRDFEKYRCPQVTQFEYMESFRLSDSITLIVETSVRAYFSKSGKEFSRDVGDFFPRLLGLPLPLLWF